MKELIPNEEATSRFFLFLSFGANCNGRGSGEVGLSSQEIALKMFVVSLYSAILLATYLNVFHVSSLVPVYLVRVFYPFYLYRNSIVI